MRASRLCIMGFAALVSACVPSMNALPRLAELTGQTRNPHDPPKGYERLFSPAPHNFRHANAADGAPIRRGVKAERFELREGDCGGSDCGNPRYRAELQLSNTREIGKVGEETWFGWSFYNSTVPSFRRDDSLRLVFGQWTMGGDASPAVRIIQLGQDEGDWTTCRPAICAGPEREKGDVVLQLEDLRRTFGWGKAENNGYVCRLFDMEAMQRRWVDLVMQTNFSQQPDGYLRVWVNGTLKCDYSGPILSPSSLLESDQPGHRRGIFSSYTKRWSERHGTRPKPTLVVYYDEFRIGASRAEVDPMMLDAEGAEPLD
ncbi:heparin lyase I family protein [Pacificoceanicola onchidii]|uniref:heparin lyase I family protein n=1 Tax=Pacificoceanicola onchidii TaxID=2562685 RepID=UPI0010A4B371|nr:heparin lyase I family protein [Pacificoceanicola onchidii]